VDYLGGVRIGVGTVVSIDQTIAGGFLQGNIVLKGEIEEFKIFYQNEYLLAERNGTPLVTTPDIIMLLESESGTPLTSETVRYGLRAALVGIPAPAIWKGKKGLEYVGPQYFGYKQPYQPIGRESCNLL
jgi:hypothetical protein